ncbi:MAG: TonB family protein [Terriglobales bacterium]
MPTRAEVSEETTRQSDAALIFVKLRKMIASDAQSTDTILGTIAVAAHSLTGATGAAIAMPRDGAVVCVGRSGETAPELGDRLNVDSGISGECLRTGVSLRCDDASRDFHVDAEVCRQMGLQSIAVVPLRGQHGRVGVLEAFSTEPYAFVDDKMELLERLAGLAEAAWARGAVTEAQATATGLDQPEKLGEAVSLGEAIAEVPALVEASPEPAAPVTAAVPLAQVREVFARAQIKYAIARRKWRLAALIAVAVIGMTLLSVYGWRAWYKASVASRSRRTASPQVTPSATANAAAGAGFAGTPDVVYPKARPGKLPQPHSAKVAAVVQIPDEVVRRQLGGTIPLADRRAASTQTASAAVPDSGEVPLIAASSAAPGDPASAIGKVIETAPALPELTIPISQGTSGGELIHKVQPVYPPEARRMRMTGRVVIDAIVNVEGRVDDLKLVSGDPMLAAAAMDAVRKWRYSPYLLNGKPIPKDTRITISFIAPQ